ncbi:hypothetical protein DW886_15885 [Enterocloster aldenensis]|uniref:hypothetical protein n=1 Tax=Enterocloster aldenensis TaxID=358742 RepID=UPI000E523034|nr:hypothetical protein DW886_15885 [Enterocloster aldenensis]
MERLTKVDGQDRLLAHSISDTGLPVIITEKNPYYKLIERLKNYEDAGMGPKEVGELKMQSKRDSEIMETENRNPDSKKRIADIYIIEHCPFCGAEKEMLEYDEEYAAVICNMCGRNFRIEEDVYNL